MQKTAVKLTIDQCNDLCEDLARLTAASLAGLDKMDTEERGHIVQAIQKATIDVRHCFPKSCYDWSCFEPNEGLTSPTEWWSE